MGERKTIFFHTFDHGHIFWQGIVLAELPLGHLEIQLFSWLTGEPTEIMIVDGKDHQWVFYTNEDAWRAAMNKEISNNDRITAMMVLEYCNDQIADDNLKTSISTQDLVWLAHSILQFGAANLTSDMAKKLAHLEGPSAAS